MFKITKLLELLIATQKEINRSLKELREDVKPKFDNISMNANKINFVSDKLDDLRRNVYTQEETVKAINKEYDYRKEYELCEDENNALLELIEEYCKYDDKYKVLELYREINSKYKVAWRNNK